MARRKKNDAFVGFIVLIVIALAIIGWLKDNVDPIVWFFVALFIIFSIIWRFWNKIHQNRMEKAERDAANNAAIRSRAEHLAWGVEKAVSIARHQKWVSPHRLRVQIHVTDKQASEFLQAAIAVGVLRQNVNGRYYVTSLADEVEWKTIEGPGSQQ